MAGASLGIPAGGQDRMPERDGRAMEGGKERQREERKEGEGKTSSAYLCTIL